MFNQLFQRETVVRQHLTAPLAESRRRYLEHCAGRGLAQSTLRSIAKHLLGAARFWPAEGTRAIARPQIEAKAAQWVAERPGRRSAAAGLALAQCTTSWLRFAGHLETPAPPAVPHADRLADFATNLRQERGLSARSVAAYVACVSTFLQRHCGTQRSLAEVTVTDLDRCLADLAARGLVQMAIRFHANALRAFFRYGEAVGWARPGLAAAIPMPRIYSGETVVAGPVWEDVQRLLGAAVVAGPANCAPAPSCCCWPCTACAPARCACCAWRISTGKRKRCACGVPRRAARRCTRSRAPWATRSCATSARCARRAPAARSS